MNISIVLDKRYANKKNQYPVKIRLYNLGKSAYIPLDIYVDGDEFDENSGLIQIIGKKDRSEKIMNNGKISSELEKAESFLIDLKRQGKDNILPAKFKELFLSGNNQTFITLNEHFRNFIHLKSERTAELYKDTLDKIERYFGDYILFEDVTYSWLENFDNKMRKEKRYNSKGELIKIGLETNTRSIHFRNIRAVFNNAIDKEIISLSVYPFRRFKIKREETIKRSMDIEHLRMLFSFDGSSSENWARDIAKLIFFLIGINIKDLYELESDYDRIIYYKRSKTGKVYEIKIEPETDVLLKQFSSNGKFTFALFQQYKSLGKKVNKYLSDICKKIEIPRITTYSIRHSWATIASDLDIPKETISEALGHNLGSSITSVYIKFNKKKIDEANRRVIDYVLYGKITNK